MTGSQARSSPAGCSGPHPVVWLQADRGFIYALLMLPLLVGQGFAQSGLQERYFTLRINGRLVTKLVMPLRC
jgi:hypothetical protein